MDEKLRVMEEETWSMFDTAHQTRPGDSCSVADETFCGGWGHLAFSFHDSQRRPLLSGTGVADGAPPPVGRADLDSDANGFP